LWSWPGTPGAEPSLHRRKIFGSASTFRHAFLAFATGNHVRQGGTIGDVRMLSPDGMNPLFQAAAEATEEAILNALVAAETMTGLHGRTAHALPHDQLLDVMRRYRPAAG
jgi:D-aminopeptidase